jgi:6-pyruvoyltetrahydropterin/6-carboxytetrahydropterin synthase
VIIEKTFRFEAAHRIPDLPDDHPCGRLHGHSYRFAVALEGTPRDARDPWLIDFGDLKRQVNAAVTDVVDHRYLNDIEGLHRPSAEVLSRWIFDRLWKFDPVFRGRLLSVRVEETCTSSVTFSRGDYAPYHPVRPVAPGWIPK